MAGSSSAPLTTRLLNFSKAALPPNASTYLSRTSSAEGSRVSAVAAGFVSAAFSWAKSEKAAASARRTTETARFMQGPFLCQPMKHMPFQDTMQGADFPHQGHGKVRSILLTSPVPESQRV